MCMTAVYRHARPVQVEIFAHSHGEAQELRECCVTALQRFVGLDAYGRQIESRCIGR